MSAVAMREMTGPQSYVPAEQILGGQVVEARGSSRVGVAAAGSVAVLGIAVTDGINPEAFVSTPAGSNPPVLNAAQLPNHVTVARSGIEVYGVTYAAAAAFGARLKAAANGQVTPMASTDDPRMLCAICVEPAGVALGATGLTRTV